MLGLALAGDGVDPGEHRLDPMSRALALPVAACLVVRRWIAERRPDVFWATRAWPRVRAAP